MSYTIPDNFKGTLPYNVNSFSVPGLMPTTTPILNRQVKVSPDGSILLPLFKITNEEPNPFPFPVAITSLDKKVLLYDVEGRHLFQSLDEYGNICFSFIVDGSTEAIPVGQQFLEISFNNVHKKWVLVHDDNPFTGGRKSGYKTNGTERDLRYVVRDFLTVPSGSESIYVQFSPHFFTAPLSVVAKVTNSLGQNPVGLTISNVTNMGFTATFSSETEEQLELEYVAWSLNSPLSISGLALEVDDFRIDDSLLIG
jgi:hypothetical protein